MLQVRSTGWLARSPGACLATTSKLPKEVFETTRSTSSLAKNLAKVQVRETGTGTPHLFKVTAKLVILGTFISVTENIISRLNSLKILLGASIIRV